MPEYRKHDEIIYQVGPLGAVAGVGDTKFLDSTNDAQIGGRGRYVESVEIAGWTWHVTSVTNWRAVEVSDEYPDGRRYFGPYVIVTEAMIAPVRRNLDAIRGEDS